MKASTAVRESVRAVLHRPALIAVEIAWRWTLGLTSFLFLWALARWFLQHTPVAQQDLGSLHTFDLQVARLALQDILEHAGGRILFLTILSIFGLGVLWTLFAGAGRTLTLRMIAARAVGFPVVALSQGLRAAVTVGCIILFFAWMWFSAWLSVPNPEAEPRWGLYILLVLLDVIATGILWGIANWVFWLASIAAAMHDRFLGSTSSALASARRLSRAPDHLDLEIAFGVLRTLLFVVVFVVSLIPTAFVSITGGALPKILLVAITLAYLAMADVLQIARVVAIVNLFDENGRLKAKARSAEISS